MTSSRAVDLSEYVMSEFSCPHCQITLRSNKRLTAGRTTDCPDCGKAMTLDRAADGSMTASPSAAATSQPSTENATANPRWSARLLTLKQIASNPVVVAWTVAIGGTLMLLIAIMPEEDRPATDALRTDQVAQQSTQPIDAHTSQEPARPAQMANAETSVAPDTQQPSPPTDAGLPHQVNNPPATAPPVDLTQAQNASGNGERKPPVDVIPANPVNPSAEQPNTVGNNTAAPDKAPANNAAPDKAPANNIPANNAAKPQPAIDIAARLEQPILEFDQTKPLELSQHIAQLEEFIGAPVRFDAALQAESPLALKQKIGLKLNNTTVGDILSGIVSRADLAYEIRDDHILISSKVTSKPRSPKPRSP